MFLNIQELQSVLYEYQMNDIAEGNDDVLQDAVDAAVSEVQTYLYASNVHSTSKCNFVCKVSQNVLKNKITASQNSIFLWACCWFCFVSV